jgi:hypothetical protein
MSTTAVLCPWIPLQFCDLTGVPLALGKVYTYEAGSSTPKDTFTDEAKGGTNTNPVILDSAGSAAIWLDGVYKIVVKDANDADVWQRDYVSAVDLNTLATETSVGLVQLATEAETLTGTLKTKAVHPDGLKYATKIDNQTAKTTYAAADEFLLGDSEDSFKNKKITATNLETQLKTDLETWVNDLIAASTGSGPSANPGVLIQRQITTYTSSATLNAGIPRDNTIPQITEGHEIMSLSITPHSVTNSLRVTCVVNGNNAFPLVMAIFKDTVADAVFAELMDTYDNQGVIISEFTPGTISPVTVSCRVGKAGSAGNFVLNIVGGVTLGGAVSCVMIVDEIDPSGGANTSTAYFTKLGSGSIDTSVSAGLIDLRTYAATDVFTEYEIRISNLQNATALSDLVVQFSNQGTAFTSSQYASNAGQGSAFNGNFNQAPQKILTNSAGAHVFTGGNGTIRLKGFNRSVATKAASISAEMAGYLGNGGGTSDLFESSLVQIGAAKQATTFDGINFVSSTGNTNKFTFDYTVYGII